MRRKLYIFISFLLIPLVALGACAAWGDMSDPDASGNAGADESDTPRAADGGTSAPAEYRRISAVDAKERIDSGDDLIILDVRTQSEYDAGHIPGAILIPNETISDTPPAALPDKDAEILIYCRSGNRSEQAARKLVAMGYTNVYDFGGIIDWGYETTLD